MCIPARFSSMGSTKYMGTYSAAVGLGMIAVISSDNVGSVLITFVISPLIFLD